MCEQIQSFSPGDWVTVTGGLREYGYKPDAKFRVRAVTELSQFTPGPHCGDWLDPWPDDPPPRTTCYRGEKGACWCQERFEICNGKHQFVSLEIPQKDQDALGGLVGISISGGELQKTTPPETAQ